MRDFRKAQREEQQAKKVSTYSKRKSGAVGSDLGSFRGSEERSSSGQAPMRGTKRGRDFEIEKVRVL